MRPLVALVSLSVLLAASSSPGRAAAQGAALLLPIRGEGVDGAARDSAATSLRRRLEERGYLVVPYSGAAAGELGLAELGEIARSAGAALVVDPELQDFAGMTSLRLRVVLPDGSLAGEAVDVAAPETLPQDAARVLARALPPGAPGPAPGPAEVGAPWDAPPAGEGPALSAGGADDPGPPRRRRRRRGPPPPPPFLERSIWIGAQLEPAIGTNRSAFYLMLGPRFEYHWRGLVAGLNLDYLYLVDWEPRSQPDYHTLAVFPVLGYTFNLGGPRFSLPLIAAGGYVPGNGGLLRFEAGLAYKPTDRLDLRFMFVCPNFWFLEDRTILFVSFSLQVMAGI